ncbi:MAG: malate synthase A, partial [Geminicoccales bacterium]
VTEQAVAAVAEDKKREAEAGCDGTWVAHPDLVPVAREQFDRVLGDHPNQLDRSREDVEVDAAALLDLDFPGEVTSDGIDTNVSVGIRYLASWLSGTGAAAIDNLMEDAATAEISRSQIWQWIRSPKGVLEDGRKVTVLLFKDLLQDELRKAKDAGAEGRLDEAAALFEKLTADDTYVEFLTLPAYRLID